MHIIYFTKVLVQARVVLVQKYAYSTSSYAIVSIPSIVCILLLLEYSMGNVVTVDFEPSVFPRRIDILVNNNTRLDLSRRLSLPRSRSKPELKPIPTIKGKSEWHSITKRLRVYLTECATIRGGMGRAAKAPGASRGRTPRPAA